MTKPFPLKLIDEETSQPWYKEGLRFQCTGCGKCCTGFPGVVWVSKEEIDQLAHEKNLPIKEFQQTYLRKVSGKWALKEDPHHFDCVFLEGKQCSVYTHRPKQCRTFPWWPDNLKSPKAWKRAAQGCEGISSSAPVTPFETIQRELQGHLEYEEENR
ncbi:MAG: YkgJ family cysteine cluster protein [Chlamydiales bacterium]